MCVEVEEEEKDGEKCWLIMELELEKEDDDCSLLDEVEELEQLLERDIELGDDELSWEFDVLELEEENEQFD